MTDLDRLILDIEGRLYRHPGAKAQAIHDETGLTETRYYQRLNRLLDTEAALEAAPVTVNRLRRLRAARSRERSGGAMPR